MKETMKELGKCEENIMEFWEETGNGKRRKTMETTL